MGERKRLPLQGLFVVAIEQAVAAPFCSSRLADAGADVVKIERPEGDFARGYDNDRCCSPPLPRCSLPLSRSCL